MRRTYTRTAAPIVLGIALVACADKAKPDLAKCRQLYVDKHLDEALAACQRAEAISASSPAGKRAASLEQTIDRDIKQRDAERAAEAKRQADAARAAKAKQEAEDAKCSSWSTICTLGVWPDGSERTTGIQSFKTKAACESTGAQMGLKCDPCQCDDD